MNESTTRLDKDEAERLARALERDERVTPQLIELLRRSLGMGPESMRTCEGMTRSAREIQELGFRADQ